jgi:hypothetical protein
MGLKRADAAGRHRGAVGDFGQRSDRYASTPEDVGGVYDCSGGHRGNFVGSGEDRTMLWEDVGTIEPRKYFSDGLI